MEVVLRPVQRVIVQGNRRLEIVAKPGTVQPSGGTGSNPDPGDLTLIFENKLI